MGPVMLGITRLNIILRFIMKRESISENNLGTNKKRKRVSMLLSRYLTNRLDDKSKVNNKKQKVSIQS